VTGKLRLVQRHGKKRAREREVKRRWRASANRTNTGKSLPVWVGDTMTGRVLGNKMDVELNPTGKSNKFKRGQIGEQGRPHNVMKKLQTGGGKVKRRKESVRGLIQIVIESRLEKHEKSTGGLSRELGNEGESKFTSMPRAGKKQT